MGSTEWHYMLAQCTAAETNGRELILFGRIKERKNVMSITWQRELRIIFFNILLISQLS